MERTHCRTQSQLGELLGVSQARVSQILSGKYPIKRGPLLNLVRCLQRHHPKKGRKRLN